MYAMTADGQVQLVYAMPAPQFTGPVQSPYPTHLVAPGSPIPETNEEGDTKGKKDKKKKDKKKGKKDKKKDKKEKEEKKQKVVGHGPPEGKKIYPGKCLVLYIFGFLYFTHIASIVLSLHMLHLGYFKLLKTKTAVVALCAVEIFGCLCVLGGGWYYQRTCTDDKYVANQCQTVYLGWIAFIVWLVFGIVAGIPRVKITWEHKDDHPLSKY